MPNPMRLPAGVSTGVKGSALYSYPNPDPTKLHSFFDDFNVYTAGDWTVTTIGTGSTALVANDPYGSIASTQSAADNDGQQHQLAIATFAPSISKKMWFKSRMKVSDATQSDWILGLCSLDTTLLGAVSGAGVTDGIFFNKDDGDTQIDVQVQLNATTGQTRSANVATCDTSYHTYGFYYDPVVRECAFYIDDVKIYTVAVTTSNFPDAAVLTPSFGILNGEGVAKVMTVDYIFAAVER